MQKETRLKDKTTAIMEEVRWFAITKGKEDASERKRELSIIRVES